MSTINFKISDCKWDRSYISEDDIFVENSSNLLCWIEYKTSLDKITNNSDDEDEYAVAYFWPHRRSDSEIFFHNIIKEVCDYKLECSDSGIVKVFLSKEEYTSDLSLMIKISI